MAEYKRDVSELKRAIGAHRIAGYPVMVPVFGEAFAISSTTSIAPSGGITGVMVRPATPMPFDIFADIMKWSDEQRDLRGWLDYFKKSGRTQGSGMSMIPADIQERLERGETASMKDLQEFYLMAWGCLDLDRNITCYSFPLTSIEIPPEKLRPGMLVEFYDRRSGRTDWMGRVAGFDIDPEDDSQVVVLVETLRADAVSIPAEGLVAGTHPPGILLLEHLGSRQGCGGGNAEIPDSSSARTVGHRRPRERCQASTLLPRKPDADRRARGILQNVP